ncbi:hypothetical protein CVT25_014411 [Psilocybe cyanescens]|uniref:Uncharacterized protein n=1 Tax=Psilocybe cyanescens TaxID=93625 RepID=A0A409XIE4_PSICY|nr:hypothetical protein CVT25_014411 [Psilocybe cyanescens]
MRHIPRLPDNLIQEHHRAHPGARTLHQSVIDMHEGGRLGEPYELEHFEELCEVQVLLGEDDEYHFVS